jgi:magnesium transporter
MPTTADASGLYTTGHPVAGPRENVDAVIAGMRQQAYVNAGHVAVCEGDRLVGIVRIEDLLAAPGDANMADIMDADPPRLSVGVDQETVVWKAVRHHESSVAVEDVDGRFLGLIPPHLMLGVLLTEHDEDMARLAGLVRGPDEAVAVAGVVRRWMLRMPWLLVGLVGAIGTAVLVGSFEERLSRNIIVAFFVPMLVYLADAAGTQTVTVVVRSLSLQQHPARMMGRELLTGVLVGATLAALFFPVGLLIWHDVAVVTAVSITLLVACSVATVAASWLPLLFQRVGVDPAYGSGPIATVVQDLLTIVIYFWVISGVL